MKPSPLPGGATVPGAALSLEARIARLEALIFGAAGLAVANPHNRVANAARAFVCSYYKITLEDLDSKRRPADLCRARFVAYHLIREHTNLPYESIGKYFAGRDHASVLNGCQVVETDACTDPDFRAELMLIVNTFRSLIHDISSVPSVNAA